MAEEGMHYLATEDVVRLRRALTLVEGMAAPMMYRSPRNLLPAANILVGILTDAVAATTALTSKPKVGTLNVYSFTSTGVVDSGVDEKVYGFSPSAWTTDRWTVAERCSLTGRLVLTTQFCS